MAGKNAGWALLAALLAVSGSPWGCDQGGETDTEAPVEDAVSALLLAVGPEVVSPTLGRFRTELVGLKTALEAEDWVGARTAWRAAMAVWQEAELHQLGPAAPAISAPGGADLRDVIYSWPTVNRCRVDQVTVSQDWENPDFFTTSLANVRGLDALETLLFSPAGANACPNQVDINSSGSWAALGEAELQRRRLDYALALTDGLITSTDALAHAWAPDGGDFSAALAAADGAPYTSTQEALNAVFHALFYLETRTKDRKLARPLGMGDCTTGSCIEEVESRQSGDSTAWIHANLLGFEALYTGGDGAGFDDLLVALGHDDLHGRVLARLTDAKAAADALSLPIDRAASEDVARLQALHDAVKALTDLLKGELATVLALQIPQEAAGDND